MYEDRPGAARGGRKLSWDVNDFFSAKKQQKTLARSVARPLAAAAQPQEQSLFPLINHPTRACTRHCFSAGFV
jgi:hypothetical protein